MKQFMDLAKKMKISLNINDFAVLYPCPCQTALEINVFNKSSDIGKSIGTFGAPSAVMIYETVYKKKILKMFPSCASFDPFEDPSIAWINASDVVKMICESLSFLIKSALDQLHFGETCKVCDICKRVVANGEYLLFFDKTDGLNKL